MVHQEKCDGCGDLFPENEVTDLGPPAMLVLCKDCKVEHDEYCARKEEFDRQCEEEDEREGRLSYTF